MATWFMIMVVVVHDIGCKTRYVTGEILVKNWVAYAPKVSQHAKFIQNGKFHSKHTPTVAFRYLPNALMIYEYLKMELFVVYFDNKTSEKNSSEHFTYHLYKTDQRCRKTFYVSPADHRTSSITVVRSTPFQSQMHKTMNLITSKKYCIHAKYSHQQNKIPPSSLMMSIKLYLYANQSAMNDNKFDVYVTFDGWRFNCSDKISETVYFKILLTDPIFLNSYHAVYKVVPANYRFLKTKSNIKLHDFEFTPFGRKGVSKLNHFLLQGFNLIPLVRVALYKISCMIEETIPMFGYKKQVKLCGAHRITPYKSKDITGVGGDFDPPIKMSYDSFQSRSQHQNQGITSRSLFTAHMLRGSYPPGYISN
ncbi:hypothetical protein RF11_04684 [Thelohanellus kitauei]|uniref:Uncharacterized protein n=1 Tax=Thelohanellus kitauei TaxID=669202 RepID=A0A0C2IXY0_THEKT|nr:hypothetical protein RF11_04684 [Thelohanellus kitauei]